MSTITSAASRPARTLLLVATVTNSLMDGQGRGLREVTVRISLVAPLNPFLLNGTGEVSQRVAVDTDEDGIWTATLLGNDTFEQANTYYLVDETEAPSGLIWAIRVPSDSATYNLRDLLITPPDGGGTVPGAQKLGDLADVDTSGEQVGDILTYTSNGQWQPETPDVEAIEFAFNSPTAPWVWQHNLNRYPVVAIMNAQRELVLVGYEHLDQNTLQVNWGTPATGFIEAR
jgi:hypothetical protein